MYMLCFTHTDFQKSGQVREESGCCFSKIPTHCHSEVFVRSSGCPQRETLWWTPWPCHACRAKRWVEFANSRIHPEKARVPACARTIVLHTSLQRKHDEQWISFVWYQYVPMVFLVLVCAWITNAILVGDSTIWLWRHHKLWQKESNKRVAGCPFCKGMTLNVEYNQLDPLLKTTAAGGDVADASGFSPYPGNINVLVFRVPDMADRLESTGGIVPEFVNPKWADSEKSKFKSPTRLESLMQDFPRLCKKGDAVGFTQLERLMSFTCALSYFRANCFRGSLPTSYQQFFSLKEKVGSGSRPRCEKQFGRCGKEESSRLRALSGGRHLCLQC